MSATVRSVLVTGGSGYIGSQLVAKLAARPGSIETLVSLDLRKVTDADRLSGVEYTSGDIRGSEIAELMRKHVVDTVVHLAAVVTPGKDASRELLHSIDVGGTQNVLAACLETGVRRIIVTSSGAAYGYHADNPVPLDENDALRGNPEFAYADHKRLVEELLARHRREHPELEQLVFRPGTILGERAHNQITDLFEKPVVLGVRGSDTPFVIIWDEDVVACLAKGVHEGATGIYNLAGDGVVTLPEIAEAIGKRYLALPAGLIRGALRILHPLGLSQYGPEQVDFLRYRPVLSSQRLRTEFGYTPEKTSREVFDYFWACRQRSEERGYREGGDEVAR
jgi:UDP-glucose 4-epimerase